MSTALAATDGDTALLKEVIQAFLEECPQLLDELQQAIRYADAPTVQRAAHTIKGAVRLFPDSPVKELAAKLEEMGRNADLANAPATLEALKTAAQTLFEQLRAYLAN
jgi:HPt (histidine-containing phosphotransfer) domain-containing protein